MGYLSFIIGERELRPGSPPYVAAEIGVNFDGDLEIARRSIEAAARSGASAAKFQTFRAEEFMAGHETVYEYQTADGKIRESMLEMFKRLELPAAWHHELATHCAKHQVDFMSSAADPQSCDLLLACDVPAIKLASEDLINLPLLRHVAGRGRPVILSTGMADTDEIEVALKILTAPVAASVMLLHCVSLYPTPDAEANLIRLVSLQQRFGLPVGYSDHTIGPDAAVAAVALGAIFIEKHFTLDKAMAGPDHALSADPGELSELVTRVNRVARQLGSGAIDPGATERDARRQFRRSIVAARTIQPGERITEEMICLKRPATGLHPHEMPSLIGRVAKVLITKDAQIQLDTLSK